MTTSRSIPKGIIRKPFALVPVETSLSTCAMLALCTSAADFFDTIFIAAACPVRACFANLTLPVAPLPSVLPSCHGPTCVLRLDLTEIVEVVEIAEFRFELGCDSLAIAETRLFSAIADDLSLTPRLPSGLNDS